MAQLQSGYIKVVTSIKHGWNTIAWAKVMHLGYFVQNEVSKSVSVAKFQTLLSKFQGHKNPNGQKFWILFFHLKRQGHIDITRAKNEIGVTSSSYTNLTMKLLIKLYL